MQTISIITATFNAAATIADCLTSVNAQTIPVEHIIIDGASTDTTLAIVSRISPRSRILSETDRGIYDAMNKGIALATGEVIGILNADDYFASPDVLAKVAAVFEDLTVDACYGDLVYIRETGEENGLAKTWGGIGAFTVVRYWKSGPFKQSKFKWGWMPPHPTFFVRRSVYEKYGLFRLDVGSAGDYELMLRFLLKNGVRVTYIPEVLVRMRAGGVSNATLLNRLKANQMDRNAWNVNGLKPYPWTLYLKPARKLGQWLGKPPINSLD